jgi:uncharacterized protein
MMRNREAVFVDTSGWIAILNADDEFHSQAVERLREFEAARRQLFTTDWILAETGNGLARVTARRRFARAVDTFLGSPNGRLVRIDAKLFQDALTLYRRSDDKAWGFVDCASFVVMGQEEIVDSLTTDQHFVQAGFRRLLAMSAK